MEFEIGLLIEESSLLRNALDVIQIQGKNAKMVANLQTKLEEHIFQSQMNLQMIEEEKNQKEKEKIQQLKELTGEDITQSSNPRGRKPKS
jgi:predicted Holliday junction resolvase-like endonuclease